MPHFFDYLDHVQTSFYYSVCLIDNYGAASPVLVNLACVSHDDIAVSDSVHFVNFIFFLPIFTGDVITYDSWQARMWLPSWV